MSHDPTPAGLALKQVSTQAVTLLCALDTVSVDVWATPLAKSVKTKAKSKDSYEISVLKTQAGVSRQSSQPLRTDAAARQQAGLALGIVGGAEAGHQRGPVELTETRCCSREENVSFSRTALSEIRCWDTCSCEQMHGIR